MEKHMSDYKRSLGKTTIAPDVLHTIARLTTLQVDGVSQMHVAPPVKVNRLFKRNYSEGVEIEVQNDVVYADLYIIIKSGYNIRDVSRCIQRDVSRAITEMVGMSVGRVNIHVDDIDYPQENEA
jgi:uncharacterized alkaline shock family protein YloU